MKRLVKFSLLVCFCISEINGLKLPGPLVYVVTPSPRPPKNNEGRSAPFYYHSWMRRVDTPPNVTTTTTTTPKTKTPDLIFAEFESGQDNMKSIRKLLERERIQPKTTISTTTSSPIYVPDDDADDVTRVVNYGLPVTTEKKETKLSSDPTDYFSMYNALHNNGQVPVYVPTTTSISTTSAPTSLSTTTDPPPINVENIWHIIDNEKYNQYSGKWEEEPVANENSQEVTGEIQQQKYIENADKDNKNNEDIPVDENFAIPGFGTNPGNGAENESRAIRTEQNIRFPYVNLKPFQMKNQKKPLLNSFSNSKKGNNMFTSLDNFHDVKNPVRGEAQDIVTMRHPIDRYNPAQPYLPQPKLGGYSKQSSGPTAPVKAIANLVPPPPPPPPKLTDNDFPTPDNYDSFPPYAPAPSPSVPSAAAPALPPPSPSSAPRPVVSMYQPPVIDSPDDSGLDSPPSDDSGAPMDVGYRYKQPPSQFLPTLPPLKKPFGGYSYDKPMISLDTPPAMAMGDKPNFQGYHYSKPESPAPSQDHPAPSYDHHGPSYHHDSDYPDLVFDKQHGGMGDTNSPDDMKDVGMVPPPPPDAAPDHGPPMDSGSPMNDHGFPHDFPGDLKFHHDFDDDHDFHHHHHHPTTTTEQPRVNRYSYYYLGKKLYYLPLYFSVYFIVYVGALIIKAVLRHKIVYPNSWRPNDMTASFFSKRSIDSWDMSQEKLHDITGRITHAITTAAQKYTNSNKKE